MTSSKENYYWLNDASQQFLERGYLIDGQTAQERIREIAEHAESLLWIEGYAEKFEEYVARGYFSLATPVRTNYANDRGLPISCFGSYIEDDMASILYTEAEVGMMSKYGGGTSAYFGELRPRWSDIRGNGQSSGSVHFMELFDKVTSVVSQWGTRRWVVTPYLPLEHGDIKEFLRIGTEGHPIQSMTYAVSVGDEWMQEMLDGDLDKRKIRGEVLKARTEVGYPYIFFRDTVNRMKPEVYKDLEIYHSNLCSEITLPNNADESFVCCLSHINLDRRDELKDTDAVEVMTFFLDTVMEDFIQKLESETEELKKLFMRRALRFAKRHRALGLGVIGRHSYLQSHMIAFDSDEAAQHNEEIFKTISERALQASKDLADKFGEVEMTQGTGRRNTTLMAIAPTTSSAFISWQTSQGIEPLWSNYFIKDTAKLKYTFKNPRLEEQLELLGLNTSETRDSIKEYDGSVQHLDIPQEIKAVFRTFDEVSQYAIIDQAATRQRYIDQSQSLNVLLPGNITPKEINQLHIHAWQQGVKTLYYQHSLNAAQQAKRDMVRCEWCES